MLSLSCNVSPSMSLQVKDIAHPLGQSTPDVLDVCDVLGSVVTLTVVAAANQVIFKLGAVLAVTVLLGFDLGAAAALFSFALEAVLLGLGAVAAGAAR